VDRLSETLFGLIMALSFTCTMSVSAGAGASVRTMLWAALGSNVAWGVVDGLMYLLTTLTDRGHERNVLSAIRNAATPDQANALILDAIPESLAPALGPPELARLRQLANAGELPAPPRLRGRDLLGAAGVALLVCGATLPIAVPFMVSGDPRMAIRTSNGIALVMLFGLGWESGRYAGVPPLRSGLAMIGLGAACVGITIALGG
jgi:VIT1/CCC1 family predicted Fe2+/Mn2+ transporter